MTRLNVGAWIGCCHAGPCTHGLSSCRLVNTEPLGQTLVFESFPMSCCTKLPNSHVVFLLHRAARHLVASNKWSEWNLQVLFSTEQWITMACDCLSHWPSFSINWTSKQHPCLMREHGQPCKETSQYFSSHCEKYNHCDALWLKLFVWCGFVSWMSCSFSCWIVHKIANNRLKWRLIVWSYWFYKNAAPSNLDDWIYRVEPWYS